MHITDPIADLLTRIRNASTAKHATVDVPASNMKKAICQILLDEGYIKGMQVKEDDKQGVITVTLKSVSYTHLVTIQNLTVVKIDAENNLIAIKGAVPGAKGSVVTIHDSVKA